MTRAGVTQYQRAFLSIVLLVLFASGCTVQYVSRYDEATEQSITQIQRSVETLLQRIQQNLGTPDAAYENYIPVYEKLHVDAALLQTRAQAIDLNSITAEQSELLIGWLGNLEELHKIGFSDAEMLTVVRTQSQQIFVAMLKFELAKKRQLDPPIIGEE
ncbi:MAG: hypothetical protein QNJ11_14030 [Woeseiaceae bacterium]|nr:hypothetical protein [Woeseiaceae bacterium]